MLSKLFAQQCRGVESWSAYLLCILLSIFAQHVCSAYFFSIFAQQVCSACLLSIFVQNICSAYLFSIFLIQYKSSKVRKKLKAMVDCSPPSFLCLWQKWANPAHYLLIYFELVSLFAQRTAQYICSAYLFRKIAQQVCSVYLLSK